MTKLLLLIISCFLVFSATNAQIPCQSNADVDSINGKYKRRKPV